MSSFRSVLMSWLISTGSLHDLGTACRERAQSLYRQARRLETLADSLDPRPMEEEIPQEKEIKKAAPLDPQMAPPGSLTTRLRAAFTGPVRAQDLAALAGTKPRDASWFLFREVKRGKAKRIRRGVYKPIFPKPISQ